MLNAIGLQNPGVEAVIKEKTPGATSLRDADHRQYRRRHAGRLCGRRRAPHRIRPRPPRWRSTPPAPTVRRAGCSSASTPIGWPNWCARCGGATDLPADHQAVAQRHRHRSSSPGAAVDAGSDALSLINTLGRDRDRRGAPPAQARQRHGGAVGAPRSVPWRCGWFWQVAAAGLGVPIVGHGWDHGRRRRPRVHPRRRQRRRGRDGQLRHTRHLQPGARSISRPTAAAHEIGRLQDLVGAAR